MDPNEIAQAASDVINDGNYSVITLIVGLAVFGAWWLKKFDERNSAEHNELAGLVEKRFNELHERFVDDLSKEAKGLGRSIDRVEETAIRVETKLDEHIMDHARGDV